MTEPCEKHCDVSRRVEAIERNVNETISELKSVSKSLNEAVLKLVQIETKQLEALRSAESINEYRSKTDVLVATQAHLVQRVDTAEKELKAFSKQVYMAMGIFSFISVAGPLVVKFIH